MLDLKQPENFLEENKYIPLRICEIITVNTNQGATILLLVDSDK